METGAMYKYEVVEVNGDHFETAGEFPDLESALRRVRTIMHENMDRERYVVVGIRLV